ncbi:MAG: Gfo/Idh/MocA family oxidoreductase [Fuerstiella sp.]|nr:Gfo/Idh/MocA family oxidoreductase [Fuerstiella sp.]
MNFTNMANEVKNSKHRMLIVGTGSIGERHLRCYLATGRAEPGICEIDAQLRNAVADRYQVKSQFGDVQEALTESWDVVLVASPAHTHIPIAVKACQSGCNVIIEKPLSTSLDGIEQLRQLIAQKNLIAAVSYQLRSSPLVQEMKAALDSGRFGKPLQLYMTSGQNFAYYRPAYRDTYFADHRTGGGGIQDSITHMLNLAEWLVGPMTRISVDASHQKLAGVTVEDTVHILARHDTVMASYALNMYQHANHGQLTVVCEDGTVQFEASADRWRFMTEPDGKWHESVHRLEGRDAMYIRNADVMLDVLERKYAPLCSLEDALQTLRVNLAALRSAATHSWQDIS